MPAQRRKNNAAMVFGVALALSLLTYFLFRSKTVWVNLIVPEFFGVAAISLISVVFLWRRQRFAAFISSLIVLLGVSVFGLFWGLSSQNLFLVDHCPEIIGAAGFALVLSLLYHKKMVVV